MVDGRTMSLVLGAALVAAGGIALATAKPAEAAANNVTPTVVKSADDPFSIDMVEPVDIPGANPSTIKEIPRFSMSLRGTTLTLIQGQAAGYNLTITNQGKQPHTVTFKASIGSQSVLINSLTLKPSESKNIALSLSTSGLAVGSYALQVTAFVDGVKVAFASIDPALIVSVNNPTVITSAKITEVVGPVHIGFRFSIKYEIRVGKTANYTAFARTKQDGAKTMNHTLFNNSTIWSTATHRNLASIFVDNSYKPGSATVELVIEDANGKQVFAGGAKSFLIGVI